VREIRAKGNRLPARGQARPNIKGGLDCRVPHDDRKRGEAIAPVPASRVIGVSPKHSRLDCLATGESDRRRNAGHHD